MEPIECAHDSGLRTYSQQFICHFRNARCQVRAHRASIYFRFIFRLFIGAHLPHSRIPETTPNRIRSVLLISAPDGRAARFCSKALVIVVRLTLALPKSRRREFRRSLPDRIGQRVDAISAVRKRKGRLM